MDINWSLKELYLSFESSEFSKDKNELKNYIEGFKDWSEELTKDANYTKEKIENYIAKSVKIDNLFSKLASFCQLTLSVDTNHKEALKNIEEFENLISSIAEYSSSIEKWLGEINNLDELSVKSSIINEHKFYLNEKIKNKKYILSDKEEAIISKMKNTGSGAFGKLRDSLTSNLTVEITINNETKVLPLAIIRNMAHEKDSELRKAAYFSELKAYKNIDTAVAACLNGIKGEVITVSATRGYSSPLEEAVKTSNMEKETLDSMISAIKEKLPLFRKYFKRKAELLGHKNGLPFYDLFAPIGDSEMKFDYKNGKKFVEDNFRTFSDDLANYAKNAFDNNWLDVFPKEGKVGGAFCANLHVLGESRFLLNYSDNFSSVVTLAHELGHGYHGHCLKNESSLNSDYPMPIAETASTFCETIVKKAAIKNSNKIDAFSILESEISDSAQIIVDILSRFLFESEVFKRREIASLSVDELNEIMIWSQKEAYGDGLDENYLHPYMWLCKPHYYDADYNFYNFPYAFGLLFAKGLYSKYLKTGAEFVNTYDDLLKATGKNTIENVAKLVNIDVTSIDFWRSSLEIIEEDIEEFLRLSN